MAEPENEDKPRRQARIQRLLEGISQRPNSTEFSDLDAVVSELERLGHKVARKRYGDHGIAITIDDVTVQVCTHNKGRKELKRCYVKAFLEAMIELEVFE